MRSRRVRKYCGDDERLSRLGALLQIFDSSWQLHPNTGTRRAR